MIRAVLSWIPDLDKGRFRDFIYKLTEPMLYPVRNLIESSPLVGRSMIDLSFLVVIIILELLKELLGRI